MRSLDALMGSDPELMRNWLEQPNHHLGGQEPRQLLASVEGLARVEAYLDTCVLEAHLQPLADAVALAGCATAMASASLLNARS